MICHQQHNAYIVICFCLIVQIRATPLGSDGRLWLEPIDICLQNPNGDYMQKWNARNAAATGGPIVVNFPLDNPTICGKWTGIKNKTRVIQ